MSLTLDRSRRAAVLVAVTTAAVVGATACSSSGGAAGAAGSKTVRLVAYSVPKPAYDALAKAFARTSAGKGVKLDPSYGPSGTQSKGVLSGQLTADLVNFSTGSDMTKLVPGKVAAGWDAGPTHGIVADSVVVIVVRKGNPKHITGWDDLVKPGTKIVTPVPESSGSAKWNILAAYQHVIDNGGSPAQAQAYLKQFYKHIVSRAASGSAATQQFLNGTGDVLISYEAEAIAARQKGKSLDYIVPAQTFLIQTPAAVTKTANKTAKDLLAFAESTAGQQIFASKGFRPAAAGVDPGTVQGANDPSNPYPQPAKLDTIAELGGWKAVNDEFFGDHGIVTKIESAGG
jgi:sulfate transport system substrate-binding protein